MEALALRRRDERALNGQGATPSSEHRFGECLERLLDERHELVGVGAVDDAMVERQREVGAGANRDRVFAVGAGDHLGTLFDRADARECRPAAG